MSDLTLVESSKGVYRLQGKLNRNTIPKSDALAGLEAGKFTTDGQVNTLDMSGVTDTDTAALAWLMNFLKSNQKQNIRFELINTPLSLVKLAKISDVDSFLSVQ